MKRFSKVFGVGPYHDESHRSRLYQSTHYIIKADDVPVEVQIRTLPQHLWAVESESFGEPVKEGNMDKDTETYLRALADICGRLDKGESAAEEDYVEVRYMQSRRPISGVLQTLQTSFSQAANEYLRGQSGNSFLVRFDTIRGILLDTSSFQASQRREALAIYRNITQSLRGDVYDVVMLNAGAQKVLSVTHPRYFVQ